MSVTIEQIILDVKRVCNKLKDREAYGNSLLIETENMNKQIESMKEFQDDMEILNKIARERSNQQLIQIIHQENPQIREIQQENRQLKACLEDHQNALEIIMQKYREHTQKQIKDTKIEFTTLQNAVKTKDEFQTILKQADKINEMAAVMQKACEVDEKKVYKEYEYLSQLVTENRGLRDLLEISQTCGIGAKLLSTEKATQTDES